MGVDVFPCKLMWHIFYQPCLARGYEKLIFGALRNFFKLVSNALPRAQKLNSKKIKSNINTSYKPL